MNPTVELVVALSFVFFLGALICSGLNELIAWATNLRAVYLGTGIRHLLANDAQAQAFWDNALVKSLYKSRKPSYIPSGTFAQAVFDQLVSPPANGGKPTRPQITAAIAKLPAGNYKSSLQSLWAGAYGDVEKLRSSLASWFDATMDRVSGWYKRMVQWILLGLGLGLAVALNVDAVQVGQRLWHDTTLRAAVVKQVGQAQSPQTREPDFTKASEGIESGLKSLAGLHLPLGWAKGARPHHWPNAVPGWLLSAIAFSLGAPFWFGLMTRFSSPRASGPPPEKSSAEA